MKRLRAGSLVWVKRRNGSWWPGRIMGLDELSSAARLKSGSAKPVQLLGREYSSVDWYNLESDRIKAFRCNEFKDFIKTTEGLKASPFRELVKYAHRTDAILHALELENKEPPKKRKMTDCRAEAHENKPVCRLKRSRCVYLQVGSRKSSERTSFHAQPLPRLIRMGGDSYQSNSSENNYSSRSTNTYSFDDYAPNGRADETSKQLSGCYSEYPRKKHEELSGLTRNDRTADDVEAPKRKIMLKLKDPNSQYRDLPDKRRLITSGNAIQDNGDPYTVDNALKCHTRTGCYGKQSKKLIRDIYFSPQFQDDGLEVSGRQTRSVSSRELLRDIKLIVETRYEGASVPLVSLMSKVNRKSIKGYPVEVEKLKDGSTKILLPIKDDAGNQMLGEKGTLFFQSFPNTRTPVSDRPTTSLLTRSVRPTARRTRVSYLPAPSPSIKKEFQSLNVPTKKTHSRLVKKENNYLPEDVRRENNPLPEEKFLNLPAVVACVPVKLIFSRLTAAVGLQPEADIHG